MKIHYKGSVFIVSSKEEFASKASSIDPSAKIIDLNSFYDAVVSNKSKEISKAAATPKKSKDSISIKEAINGARAVVKIVSGSYETTDKIQKRWMACSDCQEISSVSKCKTCAVSADIVNSAKNISEMFGLSRYALPELAKEKFCDICSCALSVMLPSKIESFKNKDIDVRPDNCWVKKEYKEYLESKNL